MAEGLAVCRFGNRVFASCASSNPTQTNSSAPEAMRELGVDIGVLNPAPVEPIRIDDLDYIIALTTNDAHLSRPRKAKRFTRARDLIHGNWPFMKMSLQTDLSSEVTQSLV